jgi:hypothetical protein
MLSERQRKRDVERADLYPALRAHLSLDRACAREFASVAGIFPDRARNRPHRVRLSAGFLLYALQRPAAKEGVDAEIPSLYFYEARVRFNEVPDFDPSKQHFKTGYLTLRGSLAEGRGAARGVRASTRDRRAGLAGRVGLGLGLGSSSPSGLEPAPASAAVSATGEGLGAFAPRGRARGWLSLQGVRLNGRSPDPAARPEDLLGSADVSVTQSFNTTTSMGRLTLNGFDKSL